MAKDVNPRAESDLGSVCRLERIIPDGTPVTERQVQEIERAIVQYIQVLFEISEGRKP